MRNTWRSLEVAVLGVSSICLAVLLIPGVLKAREGSRDLTCRHRLVGLGKGFQQYEDANRGFPPRRTGFNDGNPYGGWGGMIVGYLESEQPLVYDRNFDFFDPANKQVVELQLPPFLCPASPIERFVEIQSQASTKSQNTDKSTVFVSKTSATDFIASNGLQLVKSGYGLNAFPNGRGANNQRQPLADNHDQSTNAITDGLSNTILLIEQAGRPSVWRLRNEKAGEGQFGVSPNARGAWAGWGSIAFGAANRDTGELPGKGDSSDCSVNCNNWFGIYSFHDSAASILFCDGSVRQVNSKLDPLTFAYLTIRDDGNIVDHEDYAD